MKRKIIIVSIVALILSAVAGAVSPSVELWWAERGITPGQRVVQRLSQYYRAELYDRVLTQVQEERDKPENAEYRPQILYIQWVASRRMDRMAEGSAVQQEFLKQYPDHWLAADMHFADAMSLLANSDYPAASEKLAMIQTKWPDAKVAVKAKEIREKLAKMRERMTNTEERATTTQPGL
jgi:hypothetical protein